MLPCIFIMEMEIVDNCWVVLGLNLETFIYDEESDHSNKAVRKTPEIESGHKVSELVK